MRPIGFEHANRTLNPPCPKGVIEPPDGIMGWSAEEHERFMEKVAELYTGPRPYPEDVTGIDPLPVWTDAKQCVSCWKMSWRERLSALLFGRVWVAILSGDTQPPVYVQASREYLEVSGPSCRCYLRGWTPLGLFNTVIGCAINRVLVKIVETDTGKIVSWFWDKATDHPPADA